MNPVKLILILVVAGVAFYGYIIWRRRRVRAAERAARRAPLRDGIEETRLCPACGSYVTAAGVRACARQDCPAIYPAAP
jgi:uncharacterized iron-regulated membrane protein